MALRLVFHPELPTTYTAFANSPGQFMNFKGTVKDNKVYLQWSVKENEVAGRFWIEKSHDGQTFQTAALAFGSDDPGIFEYRFYEKAGNQKTFYRIHLVNKDEKAEYSSVISLDPSFHS